MEGCTLRPLRRQAAKLEVNRTGRARWNLRRATEKPGALGRAVCACWTIRPARVTTRACLVAAIGSAWEWTWPTSSEGTRRWRHAPPAPGCVRRVLGALHVSTETD